MKVIVTSDNHGIDCLNDIAMLHNDASYFFHCGDSLMMEKELGEYISVRGNCDYDHSLPLFRIIDVEDHKILLIHGHRYLEHYDALRLVNGGYLRDIADQDDLNKELTYKIMAKGFKPKVIVEYERVPYIYEAGNIRITFDMNITSSTDLKNFLGQYAYKRSVLPCGSLIMEVKYTEFLPDIFRAILPIEGSRRAVSKFIICDEMKMNFKEVL